MQTKHAQAQEKTISDMNNIREEQLFAKQKLQEVEATVATSSTSIITHMQQMFTTMQSSLEQSIAQKFALDPEKRPRLDDPKVDPFATKS